MIILGFTIFAEQIDATQIEIKALDCKCAKKRAIQQVNQCQYFGQLSNKPLNHNGQTVCNYFCCHPRKRCFDKFIMIKLFNIFIQIMDSSDPLCVQFPNHEISLQPGAHWSRWCRICDLLGASFLRVFYDSCKECNGILLPPPGGCKHYCEYYRKATKKQQECMSTHVASVDAKPPPLLDMKLLLANSYPDEHCCLELLGNIHSRDMYCC